MLSKKWVWAVAGTTLLAAVPANAEDIASSDQTSVQAPATEALEAGIADPAEPGFATLSDDQLNGLRGGEGLSVTNQTLTAITSGNVINGDYSAGNVALSDFALSNFNGFGNLLINTGAQVSLQTGMNVTINVGN